MTVHEVHWHEGMFLRPQHFQVASRRLQEWTNRAAKWDSHYNWGLRTLSFDRDALANYRLVIRELSVRMHDGTMIAIPEDGVLPDFDLRAAFDKNDRVIVYLGVPVLQTARPNVTVRPEEPVRFTVQSRDVEDENTGGDPQPIEMRVFNLRLLLSDQDHGGYGVIPLMALAKADRAEATPQLDESYIPPLLGCDSWRPLLGRILENTYDRLGKKIELLSSQLVSAGVGFDSESQGDRALVEQLRVMNEAYATLAVTVFAQGVHPLTMYQDLCELVGKLAIFGPERRPPSLPRYDHDDLGTCFWTVKQHIDALLDTVVEPEYIERPFTGAGLRLQTSLEPAWLERGRKLFVGVRSPLPADECRQLISRGLDMKIGSSERVDDIFRQGLAGLRFSHVPYPPRALPTKPGLVYFEVDRTSEEHEWRCVERSLSLAARLNENLFAGEIEGRHEITIQLSGRTIPMQLTLYVLPE